MPAAFCPHMAGHLFMTSALRGASFLDDARKRMNALFTLASYTSGREVGLMRVAGLAEV
jgi:hypothetical protein